MNLRMKKSLSVSNKSIKSGTSHFSKKRSRPRRMKDVGLKALARNHFAIGNHLGNDLYIDMFLRNEQAGLYLGAPFKTWPGRSPCRAGICARVEMVNPVVQFPRIIGHGLSTTIRPGSGKTDILMQP